MFVHRHEVLSDMNRKYIRKKFAVIGLKVFHFFFLFCKNKWMNMEIPLSVHTHKRKVLLFLFDSDRMIYGQM